jgi:Fe-S cluster assembly ATP-binding protein
MSMIVNGFCREVFNELPMEFAVEAQRLLSVSLEGSGGLMLHVENLHRLDRRASRSSGPRPRCPRRRGPRHHGPERLRQEHASHVLAGRDGYEIGGTVTLDGADLLAMEPEERAAAGVFMGFQYPVEIPGVNNMYFLRTALNSVRRARGETEVSARDFLAVAKEAHGARRDGPGLPQTGRSTPASPAARRSATRSSRWSCCSPASPSSTRPTPASTSTPCASSPAASNALRGPERSMIVITHYQRLLDYIKPDFVHVLVGGRIVESGDHTLALHLEDHGYADFVNTDLNRRPRAAARRPRRDDDHPDRPPRSSLDRLDRIGLPTKRDEAWRYAPHRLLGELTFGPSTALPDGPGTRSRRPSPGARRAPARRRQRRRRPRAFGAPCGRRRVRVGARRGPGRRRTPPHRARLDEISDAYMALERRLRHRRRIGRRGAAGANVDVPIHVVHVAVPDATANTSSSGVVDPARGREHGHGRREPHRRRRRRRWLQRPHHDRPRRRRHPRARRGPGPAVGPGASRPHRDRPGRRQHPVRPLVQPRCRLRAPRLRRRAQRSRCDSRSCRACSSVSATRRSTSS